MNYRAHKAISGTDVSRAVKNWDAWAFERRLKLENKIPPWMIEEPSEAMQFGTLVHMALLEPDKYAECEFMPYVESFASKEGRAIKAKALESGKPLVRAEHSFAIEHIKHNFEEAVAHLKGPWICEHQVIDEHRGIKGMVDLLTPDWIIDLKTTRDIVKAQDLIYWERYHVQLAHYCKLAPRPNRAFIFIENVLPWRVQWVCCSPEMNELADTAWDMAMKRIDEEQLK